MYTTKTNTRKDPWAPASLRTSHHPCDGDNNGPPPPKRKTRTVEVGVECFPKYFWEVSFSLKGDSNDEEGDPPCLPETPRSMQMVEGGKEGRGGEEERGEGRGDGRGEGRGEGRGGRAGGWGKKTGIPLEADGGEADFSWQNRGGQGRRSGDG